MTGRQKLIIGFVVFTLIATSVALYVFLGKHPPTEPIAPTSEPKAIEVAAPVLSKEPFVIASDLAWDDQDEAWLEEIMDQVQAPEDTHSRWDYQFDETLRPGESLITDGWEKSDGVFQFTVLTPTEVVSAGETLYQISAEFTEVNLGGEVEKLSMPRILTRSGMNASIQSIVRQPGDPAGEPEQGYSLDITPEGVPGGIRLRGTASGLARKP
jgi:hypothetical protein